MAKEPMGDLNEAPENKAEIIPFAPEVVAPISRRLSERGKITPETDYYPISGVVIRQKLAHTDGNMAAVANIYRTQEINIIGGCYDVGISGDAQTDKIIYTLCKILYKQERITSAPNNGVISLLGEAEKNIIVNNPVQTIPIIINRVEFAKEYYQKNRIGGNEVEQVTKMLFELSQQRFLRVETNEKGEITKKELIQPVFIPNLPIYESEGASPFVVLLSGIFKRENDFVLYPTNHLKNIQKATHLQNQLHDLLLYKATTHRKGKKKTPCNYKITITTLFSKIASEPKYNRRPAKIRKDFETAVKNLIEMGLIINYSQNITAMGEDVANFVINTNYHLQQATTNESTALPLL